MTRAHQAKARARRLILLPTLAAFVLVLSSACAVIGDRRVAAGCQVADGVTTYYALTHGAVEGNSLLAGASPGFILVLKLAFAYAIWQGFKEPDGSTHEDVQGPLAVVSALGCVPAANNINVIRGLP